MAGIRVGASVPQVGSTWTDDVLKVAGMTAIGGVIGAAASRFMGARALPAALAYAALAGVGTSAVLLGNHLLGDGEQGAGPVPGAAPSAGPAPSRTLPAPTHATALDGPGPRPDRPGSLGHDLFAGMSGAFDDSFYVNETADDGGFGFQPHLDATGFGLDVVPSYRGSGSYREFGSLAGALAEAVSLPGDQAVYRRGESRWFAMDVGTYHRGTTGEFTEFEDASTVLEDSARRGNEPDLASIHARHGAQRVQLEDGSVDSYALEAVDLGGEWLVPSAEDVLTPARIDS